MYYFAYGSNLNWGQMKRRCPSAKFVCVAALRDHRFAITRKSRLRGCGTADVAPEGGSEVWGVVYEIDDEQLSELDRFEDGYGKEKRRVYASGDGAAPIEVLLYVAEREPDPPPPSLEYRRLIIEGAQYWKLPLGYIGLLEKIVGSTDG